jgi:ABC-2 type transport system permease protein
MTAAASEPLAHPGGSTAGTVLSGPPRPPRPGPLSASLTFAWRAGLRLKHVPEQLTDVIGIPVIFTVMFTYLFGGAMSGSTRSYLQYLLPGTLAMTMVLLTMYSGVGLNADFTSGVSDRFRSLPIWRAAQVVGSLMGDVVRYLVAAVLVLALGLALGFRPAGGAIGVALGVGLALVFALSLSWLWTALGLVLRAPSAVMSAGFVIQFPLSMASNVFADPATMPGWLRAFVDINPMSHLVSAERALMAGAGATGEVRWVLVASVVLVLVFAPLTGHLYRRKE